MREIKFRAWNGSKIIPVAALMQKYEEGRGNGKTFYIPTIKTVELANGEYLKFDPMSTMDERVMQYTGLKDKNGVEIYEGDILEVHSEGTHGVSVVEFEEGSFLLKTVTNYQFWMHYIEDGGCEVIGNIYENPELVKDVA